MLLFVRILCKHLGIVQIVKFTKLDPSTNTRAPRLVQRSLKKYKGIKVLKFYSQKLYVKCFVLVTLVCRNPYILIFSYEGHNDLLPLLITIISSFYNFIVIDMLKTSYTVIRLVNRFIILGYTCNVKKCIILITCTCFIRANTSIIKRQNKNCMFFESQLKILYL